MNFHVSRGLLGLGAGLSALALVTAMGLPAVAQESLLPEGFGGGESAPKQAPAPKAAPKSTGTAPAPAPSGGSTPNTPTAPTAPTASPPAAPAAAAKAAGDGDGEEGDSEYGAGVQLRYDLPPGARRLLTQIGPLTVENGGFAANALGTRGEYAALLMRATRGEFASRWAHIMLRRALVSSLVTPPSVNGANLAAERAALLLRMGESVAARWLVQSVDYDRATPTMVAAAQQAYLANADPAGLCAYVPAGLSRGNEHVWRLTAGICLGFSGESGPAGWAMSRVRSSGKVSNFDIMLAERVLGATGAGRKSTTIEWDGIDVLTDWRFGLATATGVEIPLPLMQSAPRQFQSWAVLAPMIDMEQRISFAGEAAARGVLSNDGYVSMVSAASGEQEPSEGLAAQTALVRDALGAGNGDERYAGMKKLWSASSDARQQYGAMVLTARAAAALPTGTDVDADPWQLIGSMLAGGYDRNAWAWVNQLDAGSRAWGIMAVGADRTLGNISASTIADFAGDDDSAGAHRSKLLLAGLAGLGRLSDEERDSAASKLGVNLAKQSRWTRAIEDAAVRQEPALVALLVAIGMQGDFAKVPAYHLYHMTRALKAVGLEAEARMIAAEALVRV
jgi:hypothetical protein